MSENETPSVFCKNVIPMNASITGKGEDQYAVVSYLCKDLREQLFIMNRAFPVKTEEEILSFECLPYAEFDTDYISRKIEHKWLSTTLPMFTTNFQFYASDDYTELYTYAINSSDRKKWKIILTNETFMSLLYLDRYPLTDDIDNDHDLTLAVLNGVKKLENDSNLFIVSKSVILQMADATFREEPTTFMEKLRAKFSKEELVSTNVAVKLEFEDGVQLLVPFDIGVVFDEFKFKGCTMDTIEEGYLENKNQYVGNLIVNDVKLYGVDKSYMVIRGTNKDKESLIFLISDEIKENINTQINAY